MVRYKLVFLVSTEFIACKQETRTLFYETENKWTRIGEYNKVLNCFRHQNFSSLFFSTTHRPENMKNILFVARVHRVLLNTANFFTRYTTNKKKLSSIKHD